MPGGPEGAPGESPQAITEIDPRILARNQIIGGTFFLYANQTVLSIVIYVAA